MSAESSPMVPLSARPLERAGEWVGRVADIVGIDALLALAAFGRSAQPGAMLTIKCTRDGFTAQVTGPIVGGAPQPLTTDGIDELIEELEGEPAQVRRA
jgi:hypothetical protein